MHRRDFLQQLAASIPLGLVASSGLAATAPSAQTKPFKVPAGEDNRGKPISLYEGDTFFTKVSGRDTEGRLYIYESTRVRSGGPAEHVHADVDEWFYIFEGEFLIKVGDTIHEAKAGDTVWVPRETRHAWAKVNEGMGRMLILFQPAGKMEEYFQAVADGRVAKMSRPEQEAFRAAHGMRRTGPALQYQKE